MATFFDLYWFCCVNLWIIDVSLLVHWRFVGDLLKKHRRYSEKLDASKKDLQRFYWPNLQNIDVSLLPLRWLLIILSRDIFETLICPTAIFLIYIVFVVLIFQLLMFHCWFIDDSLMILGRNIDVTARISMQALMMFMGFFDLISETLMFHCCHFDDCWSFFGETYLKHWYVRRHFFWSKLFLLC